MLAGLHPGNNNEQLTAISLIGHIDALVQLHFLISFRSDNLVTMHAVRWTVVASTFALKRNRTHTS